MNWYSISRKVDDDDDADDDGNNNDDDYNKNNGNVDNDDDNQSYLWSQNYIIWSYTLFHSQILNSVAAKLMNYK